MQKTWVHSLHNVVSYRRGRLPHWELDESIYFITYRLADSLPRETVRSLVQEREFIKRRVCSDPTSPTADETRMIASLFGKKFDEALDQGHGACHLRDPRVANLVMNNLLHFDRDRYQLEAWCVMPNHVHVLMQLRRGSDLARVVHSWKSYTSGRANALLDRTGTFWQKEYFDRIVRDHEEFMNTRNYIRDNPRAAGLVNWRWIG